MALLTAFFFSETRGWTARVVDDLSSITRGDRPGRYFKVRPAYEGYFHILHLDPVDGFGFFFPFLDERGCDDFGLSGPFPDDVEVLVPPEQYHGYPPSEKGRQEYFFLIPSRAKLAEKALRGMIREMEKTIPLDDARLPHKTLDELRTRFMDAFMIESRTFDPRR